jgi:predicted ATPase
MDSHWSDKNVAAAVVTALANGQMRGLVLSAGWGLAGLAVGYCIARRRLRERRASSTIDTMHTLHPVLAAAHRGRKRSLGDGLRRRSSALPAGHLSRVVRVVLTGGPCGGKSSVLSHLMRTACDAGYDVLVVPETATIMFNGGVQVPASEADVVNFQAQLMRVQLASERAFTSIAERTGHPTIIVMDRGLLDGKGYLPKPEMWEQILTKHGVTEEYLLKRYDAIVHLVSSADGAEAHYKWGNVHDDDGRAVFRRENAEQARELDAKMRACWEAHPEHHVIGNQYGSFASKMEAATEAVMRLALKLQPADAPDPRPRTIEHSERHLDDMPGVPTRIA